MEEVAVTASKGLPARLEGDGPVCGLLACSRHAYPLDPSRSWLRKPGGRRSPAALSVLADLASEVSSSKKRLGNVNTSPVDGFGGWLSPEIHMVISAIAHHGRAEDRQVLLHLPVSLSSRQTAHRRLSGVHHDRSQSHRQWLAVTAPAGRADAVERVRPTCRAAPRCCQTKQVPKKGVEGRRREARRRPKKLRFISRGQKALAHPSLLPLTI